MSADRANDDFDDELLSAYVDGELTADERALVEERLRSDPQATRMVDQLRGLSRTLQALPRERLGYDVAAMVHTAAEQKKIALAKHTVDPAGPPIADRGFRRGFAWATIAVAATLLLAFVAEDQPPPDREVAKVEQSPRRNGVLKEENGRSMGAWSAPPAADQPPPPETAVAPPEPADAAALDAWAAPREGAADSQFAKSDRVVVNEQLRDAPRELAPAAPAAGTESLDSNVLARSQMQPPSGGVAELPPAPAAQPQMGRDRIEPQRSRRHTEGGGPVRIDLVSSVPNGADRLLELAAQQGIAVEGGAAEGEPAGDVVAAGEAAKPAEGQSPGLAVGGATAKVKPDEAAAKGEPGESSPEIVVVEGTVNDISGLIAEVEKNTQWFESVRVRNDPADLERGLADISQRPSQSGLYGFAGGRGEGAAHGGYGGVAAARPMTAPAATAAPAASAPSSGGAASAAVQQNRSAEEKKLVLSRARRLYLHERGNENKELAFRREHLWEADAGGAPNADQVQVYFFLSPAEAPAAAPVPTK